MGCVLKRAFLSTSATLKYCGSYNAGKCSRVFEKELSVVKKMSDRCRVAIKNGGNSQKYTLNVPHCFYCVSTKVAVFCHLCTAAFILPRRVILSENWDTTLPSAVNRGKSGCLKDICLSLNGCTGAERVALLSKDILQNVVHCDI